MTTFTSRNHSVATVPIAVEPLWDVLTDPDRLADLTPLVDRIAVDGERWRWVLAGISAFGRSTAPTFTERMTFVPPGRIEFHHEPQPGVRERTGADGVYELIALDDAVTKLRIDITLCIALPLPNFGRRPVGWTMAATMQRTVDAFVANLCDQLGIDPDAVEVKVIEGAGAR